MKFRPPHRDDWIYVAPLICFAIAIGLNRFEGVKALEWKTLDWRTQIRAAAGQPPPDDRLLVIGIGDHSIKNIEPWPFRRKWHAQLQSLIAAEKPSVLVWDILYPNRVGVDGVSLDPDSDDDFSLTTRQLAEQGTVPVFAAVTYGNSTGDDPSALGITEPLHRIFGNIDQIYGDDFLEMPFPGLRESGYFGSVDAPRGAGGIVRQIPMIVRVGDMVLPSLALQVVMRYWDLKPDEIEVRLGDAIVLHGEGGGRRIPVDELGMMFVNYRYLPVESIEELGREMPTVEYYDLLIDLHQKHVVKAPDAKDPVPLENRIVIVGEFSTDMGPTPRSGLAPLVFLHANILNNILQSDYVVRLPFKWIWSIALILGVIGAILVRRAPLWWSVAFSLMALGGHVWFAQWAWNAESWWVPMVAPAFGFLLLQFVLITHRVFAEQRAKTEMRGMFGSYLAPVVVERMVKSGEQPELGGVNEEITAYFSDIQSFSAFSEVLSAAQLVELLNEYLTVCTDTIQDTGGTLDKYIGDAVVAMFGAPIDQPDHAYQACRTMLLVQTRLDELREKWIREGDKWPELVHQMRTRIGLNTGSCMIGNMGSRTRFSYTMMGDNVNLAARMESGAKSWGAFNMVAQSTRDACEATGGDEIVFRPLGRIKVTGRTQPVPIHEIAGFRTEMSDQHFACLTQFEVALDRFHAQDWVNAGEGFAQSALLEPLKPGRDPGVKSNPSTVYQRIVRDMIAAPPAVDWDGVYEMKSK